MCLTREASFHQLAVYLPGFACLEFWAKRSELAERLVERHLMGIWDEHLIAGDGELLVGFLWVKVSFEDSRKQHRQFG